MQRRAVGVGVVTRVCGWLTEFDLLALATSLPEDVTTFRFGQVCSYRS